MNDGDLRPTSIEVVRDLCRQFHGYGSAGNNATYAFAVFEDEQPVAAFVWQPPPPGAARSVCPEAPAGVLALSRMVAVPRDARRLRHISKPLRKQMRALIDRTRWPVLLTYSDEGQGHTGHVYKCSGWAQTLRSKRTYFVNEAGERCSSYANGVHGKRSLQAAGHTWIQRWEHWACKRGDAAAWMELAPRLATRPNSRKDLGLGQPSAHLPTRSINAHTFADHGDNIDCQDDHHLRHILVLVQRILRA
jgi:hypothetical protein